MSKINIYFLCGLAGPGEKVKTMYLPEKNHMVFSNSTAIGVRKDLQGVLLIDTALQTPLSSHDKLVKIELPFADVRHWSFTLVVDPLKAMTEKIS